MNPYSLDDSLVLVTGATGGLGRDIAKQLASAGAAVMCVARSGSDLEAVVDEIGASGGVAYAHQCDVTREDEVEAAVLRASDLGDLRVAVTAAGTNYPGSARDYPLQRWDELFEINVRATFVTCRTVADSLLSRGVSGSLILMSSQMGTVGYPGRSAYCATKHAVEGLTKALAVEWARSGIRVNAVAPTFVETAMTMPYFADQEFLDEILGRRIPTGRLATTTDVAYAVQFLASAASQSVTGHVLRIDNGWTAW